MRFNLQLHFVQQKIRLTRADLDLHSKGLTKILSLLNRLIGLTVALQAFNPLQVFVELINSRLCKWLLLTIK